MRLWCWLFDHRFPRHDGLEYGYCKRCNIRKEKLFSRGELAIWHQNNDIQDILIEIRNDIPEKE